MASPLQILSESTQYLYVLVTADVLGVPFNPTVFNVNVAITPPNTPPSTYTAAGWVAGAQTPTVRVLVGPNGGIALTPGNYDVYVQIIATPETPVIFAGRLQIIAASAA